MRTITTWVKSCINYLKRTPIRRIKKKFGFCEYEGCWKRSKVVVDFKANDNVLATRDMCMEHMTKVISSK